MLDDRVNRLLQKAEDAADRGEPIRDGQHAKRCPEPHCDYCVHGKAKRTWSRWFRHNNPTTDD